MYAPLGASYEAEITRLALALHDLAQSIALAKQKQPAAVAGLQKQYDAVVVQRNKLIALQRAQETPSPLSLGVANIFEPVAKLFRAAGTVALVGLLVGGYLLLAPHRKGRR